MCVCVGGGGGGGTGRVKPSYANIENDCKVFIVMGQSHLWRLELFVFVPIVTCYVALAWLHRKTYKPIVGCV